MRLAPDPERLAYAEANREPMAEAIRKLDLPAIRRITDGAPRLRFTVGGYYSLCVFGAPPAPARQGEVERVDQAIGKLIGADPIDTIEQSGVVTLRGTYKGRRTDMVMKPHVFRAPNGQDIVLADMDVLAWSRA